jgi:hypothetical protein
MDGSETGKECFTFLANMLFGEDHPFTRARKQVNNELEQ